MKRPRLLTLLAAAVLVACTNGAALAPARAAGPSYNVYMNWFPEPEEGGYYYADHMGLWKK